MGSVSDEGRLAQAFQGCTTISELLVLWGSELPAPACFVGPYQCTTYEKPLAEIITRQRLTSISDSQQTHGWLASTWLLPVRLYAAPLPGDLA